MNIQTNRVIKYLNGSMSKKEKEQFLSDLNADKELKKEVALFRAMQDSVLANSDYEALEASGDLDRIEELSKEMEADEEVIDPAERERLMKLIKKSAENSTLRVLSEEPKEPKTIPLRKVYIPLAAAIAIIVLVVGLHSADPKGEKLFDNYYTSMEARGYNYKSAGNYEQNFREVISAYKEKRYEEAIASISSLSPESPFIDDALFFRGLSEMELERFDEASLSFENYLKEYTKFKVEAMWYLSLSYINEEEYALAQPYLEQLSEWETIYKKDARKLARRLRRK